MTEPNLDPAYNHEILARDFTDRYIEKSHLGLVAYSVGYDPENPICDYDETWWQSSPNRWSIRVGKKILGPMHKMSGDEIDELFVEPFVKRADDITEALHEYPVALINGHDPDLQAALSLFSSTMGIARAAKRGDFQPNFEAMTRIAHGVATRGLVPMMLGRPWFPRGGKTFVSLEQLVVSPHHSFPVNKQMIASGISKEFTERYNAKLKVESVEVAQSPTDHPEGYRTLWSMSPAGTRDVPGEGEHEGKMITPMITPGTIKFMGEMGCGFLPVFTKFGYGKSPTVIGLGEIVPPNEVTKLTLPTMMADLAQFRRDNGEEQAYYAEELGLAA